MSCPYRFIFGVPEKGFHSTRFFGFALNDTLGTIVLAFIVTYIYFLMQYPSLSLCLIMHEPIKIASIPGITY